MENLLSKIHKEEIRGGYRRRVIIVWCWLIVVVLPVFIALSFPVFITSGMRLSEIKDRNMVNENATVGNDQIFKIPELINKKAEAVMVYKNSPIASIMTEKLFTAAPVGIKISEISFQGLDGKKGGGFRVSGVAKTREMLTLYEERVKELVFVEGVDVPVESFSKPIDLSFYMNISIKN